MLSESARMSSAAEARFRVQAANSLPRRIKVLSLDEPSEAIVRHLAEGTWPNVAFFTAATSADPAATTWLRTLDGDPRDLVAEVWDADLVVMVAMPGHRTDVVPIVGEACSQKRVMTTALIVGSESSSDEALSSTLKRLRPWSLMVVIANSDDYIADMLTALRGG